jgi:hypothetical protein
MDLYRETNSELIEFISIINKVSLDNVSSCSNTGSRRCLPDLYGKELFRTDRTIQNKINKTNLGFLL